MSVSVEARLNARPYVSAFASGARRALNTPGELFVRVAFYAIILLVFSALWSAAMASNGGIIAGYDYRAMLWYVLAAEGAVIATKPRMIEDIGYEIGGGAIAVDMLRPISVVGFRIAVEYGEAVVRLACGLAVGVTIVSLQAGGPPDEAGVLLAMPAALIAVACNICAQFVFASAAFWLEDAKSTWFLYQKLIFLLGGMLLPLELLPGPLASVARLLPFWTTAYIPARLSSGHLEPGLIGVQVAWLIVLLGAAVGLFHLGEKRLQVVGG